MRPLLLSDTPDSQRLPIAPHAAAPHTAAHPADLHQQVEAKRSETGLTEISLIVPVYNEAEAIPAFLAATGKVLKPLEPDYRFEIVFINDGSRDKTLDVLIAAQEHDPRVVVVDLSRNFGKEAALTAGLDQCNGAAAIPIDVDLQDPPELIPQMIAEWMKGFEVVAARRVSRETDTFVKRLTGRLFYKVHNALADQKLPQDVGDFRLIDRKVIDVLKDLPERRRFMKGLFSWVGFRTTVIDYTRQPRAAGKTKFRYWKLWNLALEGITGFSTVPLRIWTYLGAVIAGGAFTYMIYFFIRTLLHGNDVKGYPSLLLSILFLGGVQLIGIGVLGEYLGRVYEEVKQRPKYIVRSMLSRRDGRNISPLA